MVTINEETSPFYDDTEKISDEDLDMYVNDAVKSYNNMIINENKIVKSVYVTKFSVFSLILAVNFITYFYYYSLSNQKLLTY